MTAGNQRFAALYGLLRGAWSAETGRHWRPDNPACGQCGVTALLVHDLFGGDILKTDIDGAWHFYNRIDSKRVDFTMLQFATPIGYDVLPSSRQKALADCSPEQYQTLCDRFAIASTDSQKI